MSYFAVARQVDIGRKAKHKVNFAREGSIVKIIESILKISLREIARGAVSVIRLFTAFFKAGVKNLVRLILEIFEEFRAFLGIGFRRGTRGVLEKLGLTWRRIEGADDIYEVLHEGKVIFKGTKKELEAFVDELAKLGDGALARMLDELAGVPVLYGDYWEVTNPAGTRLRWLNQKSSKVNLKNNIQQRIASNNPDKAFEGLAAEEVSKYQELTAFSKEVEIVGSGTFAGEIDAETSTFLFEFKRTIGKSALETRKGDFLNQFSKYLDSGSRNYINIESKPVVLVVEELRVPLSHPTLQELESRGVKIIVGIWNIEYIY